MRHNKKHKKLNRSSSHRKALLRNLCNFLVKHESMRTTLAKAKALRPVIERLISRSRRRNVSDLHTLRVVNSFTANMEATKKLVRDLSVRFKNRPGGYTRILKLGSRSGDCAPMAIIEFSDFELDAEKTNKS